MLRRSLLATGISFSLVYILSAGTAQAAKGSAVTDPAKADADFAFQGEYSGEIKGDEALKMGVQVIALGDGKFHGVGYHGGLPGDGWDGKNRTEGDGALKDGVVTISGPNGTT